MRHGFIALAALAVLLVAPAQRASANPITVQIDLQTNSFFGDRSAFLADTGTSSSERNGFFARFTFDYGSCVRASAPSKHSPCIRTSAFWRSTASTP